MLIKVNFGLHSENVFTRKYHNFISKLSIDSLILTDYTSAIYEYAPFK